MTNRKVLIASLSVMIATLVIMSWVIASRKNTSNAKIAQLGFPFEIVRNEKLGNADGLWSVDVRLGDQYLSKENLELLFHYYSEKHSNSDERVHVNVYTYKTLKRIAEDPSVRESGSYLPNAAYLREDVRTVKGGELNEWYSYDPDPENQLDRKRVVLSGTDPFGVRTVTESWNVQQGGLKISVFEYELEGVEPKGVYYSFETEKGIILSVREDHRTGIPRSQVRFLNDQIAYLFMDSKYGFTSDGGGTWSLWNAEKELYDGSSWFIQDVQIQGDGAGTMRLRLRRKMSETLELRTSDFGGHWN